MTNNTELFKEYYENWKKQTQFIYEGHFDNKWYKKIIEEIDPKTILIESYKIICKRNDWIAYAIEETMRDKFNTEIVHRERPTEYIPLDDYCNRIKKYIKENLINGKR